MPSSARPAAPAAAPPTHRAGPGRAAEPRPAPPRSSLTWPVPPARVHPPAQPAFLGRGAVAERRQLRAEQQRVRRLPAAAVAQRLARGVEAVLQQPAEQRAGGGGGGGRRRPPRRGGGLGAQLLPHGGGLSPLSPGSAPAGRGGASAHAGARARSSVPLGMRSPPPPPAAAHGAGVLPAARCRGAAAALRRGRGDPLPRLTCALPAAAPGTCGAPRAAPGARRGGAGPRSHGAGWQGGTVTLEAAQFQRDLAPVGPAAGAHRAGLAPGTGCGVVVASGRPHAPPSPPPRDGASAPRGPLCARPPARLVPRTKLSGRQHQRSSFCIVTRFLNSFEGQA